VPLIVTIDPQDPGYEIKVKLKNDRKDFMKFRVVDNLHEQIMIDMISFLRYTYYEGDLA
jgi:hypothetical protein